jgi:hypothetical protein
MLSLVRQERVDDTYLAKFGKAAEPRLSEMF